MCPFFLCLRQIVSGFFVLFLYFTAYIFYMKGNEFPENEEVIRCMKNSRVDLSVSDQQLEKELKRTVMRSKSLKRFRRFFSSILVVGALLVIVTVTWLPVFQITGKSMEPTLEQGQIVVALRTKRTSPGDIVAIYFENQILIKRVIGTSGDQIQLDEQGKVSVNGIPLEEEYLSNPVRGTTDLSYPYDVPEGYYFVMGDNREKSMDSRMSQFGCVAEDRIAGKLFFSVWPLNRVGFIG